MTDRLLSLDGCQEEACRLHRLLQVTQERLLSAPPSKLSSAEIYQITSLVSIAATMAEALTNALLEDFEAHAREAQL